MRFRLFHNKLLQIMGISSASSNLSLDDIVFQGRNRAYGAYLLRKLYSQHLNLASAVSIGLFVLLLLLPGIVRQFGGTSPAPVRPAPSDDQVVTLTQINLPPIEEPVVPPPAAAPQTPPAGVEPVKTVKHTALRVVPNEQAPDPVPTVDDFKNAVGGTETKDGTGGQRLAGFTEGEIDGQFTEAPTALPTFSTPYLYAEVMPAFPGGEEAMLKFMSENVSYPLSAKRAGISGTVFVSFTVGASGNITDIKVVKSLGGGTDEEAIRLIKSMPNWLPGKMNGREVPVRLTLPIRFVLK